MNCANHPERMATAFCQNCGKALCPLCTRTHAGLILCEPCLLQREAAAAGAVPPHSAAQPPTQPPGAANTGGWAPVSAAGAMPAAGMNPNQAAWNGQRYGASASPVLAGLLGFIPGVGAMYNGQFIKALLHVVIFIVLVGATDHFDLVGILIPAWIFYQVFDAAQTAAARRDGRPLPDPFGILDMSRRLGPQAGVPPGVAPGAVPPQWTQAPYAPPGYAAPGTPPAPQPEGWQGDMPQYAAAAATGTAWAAQPYQTAAAVASPAAPVRRSEPIGAIVLIVVGLLFLLSTLGWLSVNWIYRGWPVLLLLLGVWLLVRRVTTPAIPPTVPVGSNVAPPQSTGAPANALSIAPWRDDAPRDTAAEDRSNVHPEDVRHEEDRQ